MMSMSADMFPDLTTMSAPSGEERTPNASAQVERAGQCLPDASAAHSRVYPVRACAAEAAASESLRLRMGGCIRACGMHGETLRYRYRTPPAFVSPAHRIREVV